MVNIRSIRKISDNGGLTLRDGKIVSYKSGYQVATNGIETPDIQIAMKYIRLWRDCGVWFSNGIWYIDKSYHISTKYCAVALGKSCNQQSILKWADMSLLWLQSQGKDRSLSRKIYLDVERLILEVDKFQKIVYNMYIR